MMKKAMLVLLILALALPAAGAETAKEGAIESRIEDGSFFVRIPVDENDPGLWYVDDSSEESGVVTVAKALVEDAGFVAQFDPLLDGEVTVALRHDYNFIASDRAITWDLKVQDGAIVENTGGSYTEAPAEADQDPFLSGEWLEKGTQFTQMTIKKNPEGGWDVEAASPLTHGAYVFRATMYFDCFVNAFRYFGGLFYNVPVTDTENGDLGEPVRVSDFGYFQPEEAKGNSFALRWIDMNRPEETVLFVRADAAEEEVEIALGASSLYSEEDLRAAIPLIEEAFSHFEGCVLHSIRYGGDESNTEENIRWMNELKEDQHFTQCALFLSDFYVGKNEVLENDSEYTAYQWWLARPEGGAWQLLTWGY